MALTNNSSSSAVDVENLTFSYKRHGVINLESINMHVPRGTIYGLLGPSGCGKTTLLRCIVGRLKPRCGNVNVFGYRPGIIIDCKHALET
ncbi:hypothetical protein BLA29_009813 [Euroglyphus maynei]|uniref:ABC transporter domain-containing protein n=1 Tax=Euroglyphus maynei TaxID=6958 RepID=A0A1Y3BIB3_EURMA|nr:hypothetical protein BLA29_009813 [Euroglyphus maynei]